MDAAAFSRAYRSQMPPVRATCRRLLGDAALAEDVAQEAFARLWREGQPLAGAGPAAIAAWLYRTSTHLAIDVLRARKRPDRTTGEELTSFERSDATGSAEAVATARRGLETLRRDVPAPELEAAVLARAFGLGQAEVAAEMGVSERTVRRLLGRFDRRATALRSTIALAVAIGALFAGRSCAASPGDVDTRSSLLNGVSDRAP